MSLLSRIGYDWAVRCFGLDHVKHLALRSQRTLEESAELSQALGLSREDAHKTIDTVYDRPVGDPEQEIGGILHTVGILCESMSRDPDVLHEREVRRVLKKSPEHFAKRNQEKLDLGLDASAQSSGDLTPDTLTLFKGDCGHRWIGSDAGYYACPVCGDKTGGVGGDHHLVSTDNFPVQVDDNGCTWHYLADAAAKIMRGRK